MPTNGAHKEESPGGWTDHSHCPWLFRLSRSVSRNSVTTSIAVGIRGRAHTRRQRKRQPFRMANVIGARMMSREQLQAEIATQEDAMASLQARLKSREFSRAKRDELEREILMRIQLRYIALHDLRRLGK